MEGTMANRSATLEREHATPEQKPRRGSEHARLDEFVGTWTSEGLTAAGPSGPAEKMAHEHTYEWLPGRFFLLHRWDGLISERESRGIEIIGYDASKRAY